MVNKMSQTHHQLVYLLCQTRHILNSFFYKCNLNNYQKKLQHPSMLNNQINLKMVNQTYKIVKKIDQGAFGQIYQGLSTRNNKNYWYAIKIQSMRAEHPQLIYECKLYNQLHSDPSVLDKGIPNVYYCGVEDEYNILVMDLMGPSLQSLLNQCNKKFTLKTVLMLIDQMISRIEYLHSRSFLHRDIKPDNFCIGLNENSHKLFILDFGLAKKYFQRGKHIPYRDGKSLTGTARYASINTHLGVEQACRDDMESIGYVSIYFLKGSLPWQGQKGGTKQDKHIWIKQKKIKTSAETLCKGLPEEFTKYFAYVKGLNFQQRPNYKYLRSLFKDLFNKCGYTLDYQYDWAKLKTESKTYPKQLDNLLLK